MTPTVVEFYCVQCRTPFTGLIYQGPGGPALALFPSVHGGLRTHHTPEGVAYYLDQASRSESGGANSAAVAMYRGALDHLLFGFGYTEGMTGKKLANLRLAIDIAKGVSEPTGKTELPPAPSWALDLDTEFLEVLTQLGSGAIHRMMGTSRLKRRSTPLYLRASKQHSDCCCIWPMKSPMRSKLPWTKCAHGRAS